MTFGEAASGVVGALKEQPALLSMIVSNLLLIGFLYYTGVVAHQERQVEVKLMYENRSEMAKLLAACYPAPPH